MKETEILYLIWSNEHAGWWKADRRGYSKKREQAGKYTYEDALEICDQANIHEKDIPNEAMVPIEVCSHCYGSGVVTVGQYDDVDEKPCPFCSSKWKEHDGDGPDD